MYNKEYERWSKETRLTHEIASELSQMNDDEITSAFKSSLNFGTAGIRGIIGAGTYRINEYVIGRVSKALAEYINSKYDNPKIVIGYDTRKNSKRYALLSALVLKQSGINALVFKDVIPVSGVSFGTRQLGCVAGIMITASHNPKEYNGYKVYNEYGYQITGDMADDISVRMESIDYFDPVITAIIEQLDYSDKLEIEYVDRSVLDEYHNMIVNTYSGIDLSKIKILYTPLNGAGKKYVEEALLECGIGTLEIVPAQGSPDQGFTTCPKPNPELISAYTEAIRVNESFKSNAIIATDPDCDRVGVMIRNEKEYRLLSGNELGILLFDYLINREKNKENLKDKWVCKSIVTAPIVEIMAKKRGIRVKNTLVGFKYIGEFITKLESEGDMDDFLFGFEESNGYLCSTFSRDKDGVSTVLLVCQMLSYLQEKKTTVLDKLEEIYNEYGYQISETISNTMDGINGMDSIRLLMETLRESDNYLGQPYINRIDYLDKENLHPADMLEYTFENNIRMVVRPSGTEPKIKRYIFSTGDSMEIAKKQLDEFKKRQNL